MPLLLFICYSGAIGGAERLLLEFADGLDGELCIACPEGTLAERCRQHGLRVLPLPRRTLRLRGGPAAQVRALAALLAHGRETRALIRDLDPDLVLVWGMRSAIATLVPGRPAAPTVFQHNDLLPAGSAIQALVRAAARRADRVVALSHAIADDLGGLAQVVHPGVDVAHFELATPESPAAVDALLLGALVEWKRPDLALEAAAIARRSVPELRLRLVGAPLPDDGDVLVEQLRMRAAEIDLAGAVEFAGSVADPAAELSRAACLLHCAEREPFGMVVLEALASGLPVVVPSFAGPAEIADRSCGVLYPPGDAEAAAAGLVELFRDRQRAGGMGAAGRERARRQFDRRRALERYRDAVMPLVRQGLQPQPPASPPLALVTVTHNSARELRGLLASVERHLPGTSVVVVDCGSSDDSLTVARGWSGRANVVPLENVGFGTGCNRGVAEVQAPVTLLVNPDLELLDDSLRAAAAEALLHERILAPLVLTPAGVREDSVHPVPGSAADLLAVTLPHGLAPAQLVPWRSTEPRPVGWAVGCALIARTDTLRRLGPFDERIFLYGEDLDLGLRAGAAGVETWFWPAARVLHHRSHSTSAAFGGEPVERLMRARYDVVARRLGAGRAKRDATGQRILFGSRLLAKRALGRPVERERRLLEALRQAASAGGSESPPRP